jgi:hypothetical protein
MQLATENQPGSLRFNLRHPFSSAAAAWPGGPGVAGWGTFSAAVLAVALLAGCQSPPSPSGNVENTAPAKTAAIAPAPAASAPASPDALASEIRIKAGSSAPYTDSSGKVWLPDQGFDGGEVVDRADDMEIANTKDPAMFRTEHYGMDSFSRKLPNGKYLVKLYFAETFEGVDGPGQRVFSFDVAGHSFKDFDVWVKAGGPHRAYTETVPVEITDGKLLITFKAGAENPEINAIEITPAL